MSWCLSDVVEMHSNLGAAGPTIWDNSAPSIIYPALDPTGSRNVRPVPTEPVVPPAPRPTTSSRRPTVMDQAKAVFNWPRDANGAKRNPLHRQLHAPERPAPAWQNRGTSPVRLASPVGQPQLDGRSRPGGPPETARRVGGNQRLVEPASYPASRGSTVPPRPSGLPSGSARSASGGQLRPDTGRDYQGNVRPIPASSANHRGSAVIPSHLPVAEGSRGNR